MADTPGDYQREYLLRLPLPVAQLYSRAYNAKDPRGRHDNGFYLCEALVKLLTAPAAACYLEECRRGQARSAAVDRALAALALPSLGQWVGMLRELARHFGTRVDAATHPLGALQAKLTKRGAERSALAALYRRIKNGPDGAPAGDTTCSVLELFDALVPYRNGVFGHGGNRFDAFYADDLGPLLFPALNELLNEATLDPVGPTGARLAYITELRTLDDGRVQVGLRELVGLQGERAAPLELRAEQAQVLLPNRVVALWPGRAVPLRLDPLLQYRESELAEEVLFLNRDRNGRQVEYLSYTTGRTERDRSMQSAMAALLSDVAGRTIDEAALQQLAERSLADTPSFEALLGPAMPPAQAIGDYELLAELGRGAMGVVYLARQLSLGRLVAMKMLPADLAADEVALARFRREIRHLARCDHPNIIKVLGTGTAADGRLYYAMEYVPGSDLEQVWRELAEKSGSVNSTSLGNSTWARAVHAAGSKARSRAEGSRSGKMKPGDEAPLAATAEPSPLPPLPDLPIDLLETAGDYTRRVVMLVRDTARALQVVHDQGIVHRDVKPANLMITPDGSRVVLMDFGLAKGHTQHTMAVSQSGGFLGTLRYAAPEQLAAAKMKVGPQADIRALGVTLWELLTRRRLFAESEDEASLAAAVYDQDVPRLRTVEPGFDRDLEAITARACERRIRDRILTAGQFADYLQLWLDRKPLPIRTPGLGELARRWVREHKTHAASIATAGTLIVVVTAAAFALINQSKDEAVAARDDAQRLVVEKAGLADANARLARSESQQRTIAERETARLRTDRGLSLCEQGASNRGILWLAQALKPAISSGSSDLEAVLRANLESWSREVPTLLTTMEHPTTYNAAMSLSDDGRYLATIVDDGVRFWNAQTGEQIGDTIEDHTISAVVFSPGARVAAVCDRVAGVQIYDLAKAKAIGKPLRAGGVEAALFSLDGRTLITLGTDKLVRIWDGRTFEELPGHLAHPAPLVSAALTRDGNTLFTNSEDKKIRIWDVSSQKQIREFAINSDSASLHLTENGNYLFTADPGSHLSDVPKIWNCKTGAITASFHSESIKQVAQIAEPPKLERIDPKIAKSLEEAKKRAETEESSDVYRYALCPDGRTIVVMRGYADEIAVIELATGETVGTPWKMRHDNTVSCMAVSPDQRTLVSGSDDRTARLWDLATGMPVGPPLEHPEKIEQVAFSPDGFSVYTLTEHGTIRRWRAFPETPRGIQVGYFSATARCRYAPDGRQLIIGTALGAQAYDTETHAEHGSFVNLRLCTALAITPDGKRVAGASSFGQLSVWDAAALTRNISLTGHAGDIRQIEFSPSGSWLASAAIDGAQVWDADTGKPIGPRLGNDWSGCLAFDPTGRRLLVGTNRGARVWEVPSGNLLAGPFLEDDWINAVAFSPDGRTILIAGEKTAQLWNSETFEPCGPPLVHQAEMTTARFSPDGSLILTAANDNTAQLWDAKTGRTHGAALRHQGPVTAAVFTSNGKIVITGSKDGVVRMWDANTCLAVSPPYQYQGEVTDLAAHPDDAIVAVACRSEPVFWFLPIPSIVPGEVERLIEWTEIATCLKLDPNDNRLQNLEAKSWQDLQRRLAKGGGPPAQATAEEPLRLSWHDAVAAASIHHERYYAALWHLNALMVDDPESPRFLDLRSLANNKLEKWEQSIADCTDYLKSRPDSHNLLARRGYAYIKLMRWDEALADFTEAHRLAPRDADYLGRIGNVLGQKREFQAAVDKYTEALGIRTDRWWYWAERGDFYGWLQKWPESAKDYTEAIRLNPDNETVWLRRGNALGSLKQWDKALIDYNVLIKLNPNAAEHFERRSVAYHELGRADDAIADLNECVRLSPGEASYWNTRGDRYFEQSNWERALTDYSEAIKLDPKSVVYRWNRAYTYGRLAKNDEAIADLDECIKMAPEKAALWNHRGNRFFRAEAWEKSLADQRRAVALDPKNPVFLRSLAEVLIKLDRVPEAKAQLEASLSAASDDADSWNTAGITSVRIDDLDSARRYFQRAAELDSQSAVFLRNLAAVQAQQHDWETAYHNYVRLLGLSKVTASFQGEAALLAKKLGDEERYAAVQRDVRKLLSASTDFSAQQPLIWISHRFGNDGGSVLAVDQILAMLDQKEVDQSLSLLTRGTVCLRHARYDESAKHFSDLLKRDDSKTDRRTLALFAMSLAAKGDKTAAAAMLKKARSTVDDQIARPSVAQTNRQLTWQTEIEVELLFAEAEQRIGKAGSPTAGSVK